MSAHPSPVHPPTRGAPARPSRWRRVIAAVGATAAVAAGVLVAAAPPAHALDTAFTTVNRSGQPLVLAATPKGDFAVRPTSVANGASDTWNVQFNLGRDNWADVHYGIEGTGYNLWLSANPAYAAYPAELRCTIRNLAGFTVTSTPQGFACVVSGTEVTLSATAPKTFQTVNQTYAPLTVAQTSGSFSSAPQVVAAEGTSSWGVPMQTNGSYASSVTYAVGTTGYRVRVGFATRATQPTCTILNPAGTPVTGNPIRLTCAASSSGVTVAVPKIELRNLTGVEITPEQWSEERWFGTPDLSPYGNGQTRSFYPDLTQPTSTTRRLFFPIGRNPDAPGRYVAVLQYDASGASSCLAMIGPDYLTPTTRFACDRTSRGFILQPDWDVEQHTLENRTGTDLFERSLSGDWIDAPGKLGAQSKQTLAYFKSAGGSAVYKADSGEVGLSVTWDRYGNVPTVLCGKSFTCGTTQTATGTTIWVDEAA